MRKAFRRSLTPGERLDFRTSLYEDNPFGVPPEIGEYPVKGNVELPEHMRRAHRLPPIRHAHSGTLRISPPIPSADDDGDDQEPGRFDPLPTIAVPPAPSPDIESSVSRATQTRCDTPDPSPVSKADDASPSRPRRTSTPQVTPATTRSGDVTPQARPNALQTRSDSDGASARRSPAVKPAELKTPHYSYIPKVFTADANRPVPGGRRDSDACRQRPIQASGQSLESASDSAAQRVEQAPPTDSPVAGSQASKTRKSRNRAASAQSTAAESVTARMQHTDPLATFDDTIETPRPREQSRPRAGYSTMPALERATSTPSKASNLVNRSASDRKRSSSRSSSVQRPAASLPLERKSRSRSRARSTEPHAAQVAPEKAKAPHPPPDANPDLTPTAETPQGITTPQATPRSAKTISTAEESSKARTAAVSTAKVARDILDLDDSVDTEVIERQAPAVVHETVIPEVHQIREEVIYREIHTHEVFHRILPVIDVKVLPARHYVPDCNGLREVSAEEVPGRQSHWQIVETVTSERFDSDASIPPPQPPTTEPVMVSTRSYTTPYGYPRTETVWKHPPTYETGATLSGHTWPLPMHPVERPGLAQAIPASRTRPAVTESNGSGSESDTRSLELSRPRAAASRASRGDASERLNGERRFSPAWRIAQRASRGFPSARGQSTVIQKGASRKSLGPASPGTSESPKAQHEARHMEKDLSPLGLKGPHHLHAGYQISFVPHPDPSVRMGREAEVSEPIIQSEPRRLSKESSDDAATMRETATTPSAQSEDDQQAEVGGPSAPSSGQSGCETPSNRGSLLQSPTPNFSRRRATGDFTTRARSTDSHLSGVDGRRAMTPLSLPFRRDSRLRNFSRPRSNSPVKQTIEIEAAQVSPNSSDLADSSNFSALSSPSASGESLMSPSWPRPGDFPPVRQAPQDYYPVVAGTAMQEQAELAQFVERAGLDGYIGFKSSAMFDHSGGRFMERNLARRTTISEPMDVRSSRRMSSYSTSTVRGISSQRVSFGPTDEPPSPNLGRRSSDVSIVTVRKLPRKSEDEQVSGSREPSMERKGSSDDSDGFVRVEDGRRESDTFTTIRTARPSGLESRRPRLRLGERAHSTDRQPVERKSQRRVGSRRISTGDQGPGTLMIDVAAARWGK